MNILCDYHTHTTYSDGKNSPEEMILSAVEKGFTTIGITDHAYVSEKISWWISKDNISKYKKELYSLKEKYKDKIRVLVGVEYDVYSDDDLSAYEYAIGSVHFVDKGGRLWPVDSKKEILLEAINTAFGGDSIAFCEEYYRLLRGFADDPYIKIIGHFDLVEKFNEAGDVFDPSSPRYRTAALETLRVLCRAGKIFEINTGAMHRVGRTHPYPADFILEEIARLSGKVCFSSDSHSTATIGYAFDRAAALCEKFGIEYKGI